MKPGEENSAAKKGNPDDGSSETTPSYEAKRLKNIAEIKAKIGEIFKKDIKKRRKTVISDPGASIALQGGSKPKIDSIKPSKPGKKAANVKERETRKRRKDLSLKDYNEDSSESDDDTGMLWRTC